MNFFKLLKCYCILQSIFSTIKIIFIKLNQTKNTYNKFVQMSKIKCKNIKLEKK